MWKVLLVEDEIFVRESIRETIQWNLCGFELAAEAGNGLEALNLMKKRHFDLVIADIMMPTMDGLELLKQARALGMASRFVMLTCMGEFDYVRQALEYGASNYILKLSMNVQSLRDILDKMNGELSAERRKLAGQADWYYAAVWERMFQAELMPEVADMALPAYRNWASLHLRMFVALNGDTPYSIGELCENFVLEREQISEMHVFSHLGITTFFCWSDQELAVIPRESAAVPMVYSPSTRMNELQEVWISLIRALEFYWHEHNEGVSKTAHCSSPGQTAAYFLHGEMELVRQFEQGQLDVCIRWIKRMWEQMKTESWPIPKVKHMAVQLRREMARLAQAGDPDDRQVDGFVRHRQLEAWMLDQLKLDLELYMRHTKMWSDHPEINKIIDYINQHYAQNITLRFMAQYVALDENYVSSLFKKKTGESLIHYVQRTRVEQAKALLLETESPVSDIGLRVGFENDNYFIKIFRRFMDVTPSQYSKSANQ